MGSDTTVRDARLLQWWVGKCWRHVQWARTEGLARLVEEDQLDPRDRIRLARARRQWRDENPRMPGSSRPVFVVGLQRSGSNMLVRGFAHAPEVEVHNENDREAFYRFRLRSNARVRELVERSTHDVILFKPLCDSHRIVSLLDDAVPGRGARAIWIYRDVDDRVSSSVRKFGDENKQSLRLVRDGRGDHLWEAGGLGEEHRALLRGLDLDAATPETASALLWYLRNSLYFEMGLHLRKDVLLVSYDDLVERPGELFSRCAAFAGVECRPELWRHMSPRSPARRSQEPIDGRVRALCVELSDRLRAASLEPVHA